VSRKRWAIVASTSGSSSTDLPVVHPAAVDIVRVEQHREEIDCGTVVLPAPAHDLGDDRVQRPDSPIEAAIARRRQPVRYQRQPA
jgi:hypothetical protein